MMFKVIPSFTKYRDVGMRDTTGMNPGTKMRGKLVYAHPKGRFITLEFKFGNRVLRECFRQDELL